MVYACLLNIKEGTRLPFHLRGYAQTIIPCSTYGTLSGLHATDKVNPCLEIDWAAALLSERPIVEMPAPSRLYSVPAHATEIRGNGSPVI